MQHKSSLSNISLISSGKLAELALCPARFLPNEATLISDHATRCHVPASFVVS